MRINLFGGPGAGKSGGSGIHFGLLKRKHVSIELAREVVKDWVYQGRKIHPLDQVSLLGMQWNEEHKFLGHGVKNVITDSPIFLGYIYSKLYASDYGMHEHILELVNACEKEYPSINIFLNRGDKPYDPNGRLQTLGEAKEIDELIKLEMDQLNIKYYEFATNDDEGIVKFVLDKLD